MAARKKTLRTRTQVLAEMEVAYHELLSGNWEDLTDRDYLQARRAYLETFMKVVDDSDITEQITALKERVDAITKPRNTVTPIGAKRRAG